MTGAATVPQSHSRTVNKKWISLLFADALRMRNARIKCFDYVV